MNSLRSPLIFKFRPFYDVSYLGFTSYIGLDLNSKIEITSEDSSIPLDTSLTVNNVEDSSIKNIIGTDNYKSYDISLYSDAKNSKIEKLEDGKFLVKIPVPTELNGKDLIVYYITIEGTTEEHEVTVKDGYASFETNHFSTYVLAEKVTNEVVEIDEENPNTYDGIITWVILGLISITGIVGTLGLRKKQSI